MLIVFLIDIPEKLGAAQAIYYDIKALGWIYDHIEKNHIENPIAYILASRIGSFEKRFVQKIHNAGGLVCQNPDGECEIIGTTGEKPVNSMFFSLSVSNPNLYTEYQFKKVCPGFLKRFCNMPKALWYIRRAFLCWNSILNSQS